MSIFINIINKYLPVTTKEKVDLILDYIPVSLLTKEVELEITTNIEDLDIQAYLKGRCDELRKNHIPTVIPDFYNMTKSEPRIKLKPKPKSKAKIIREHTPEHELQCMLTCIPVYEISELIDIPINLILRIIKQNMSEDQIYDKNSFLPSYVIACNIDFFFSAFTAKQRKDKLEKHQLEKSSPRVLEEKFKPSYGKEGNYSKLILYGPKT